MADLPYRPRVQIGSLRQTTKKMMSTKVGNTKVGDQALKKFLKDDKGLRRVAYGDKSQTMESWRGRHYMKDVKEKIDTSGTYKESHYGRHHSAEQAFRDTVKEEIRQEAPAGPNKDQQLRDKRVADAKKNLNQYQRAREIEKDSGRALGGGGSGSAGDQKKGGSAGPSKAVPLAGGGVPTGSHAPHAAARVSYGGGGASSSTSSLTSMPPVFGFRARILRVEPDQKKLFIHVLNAPTPVAMYIGRDLTVTVPADARCRDAETAITPGSLKTNDLVDIRGKSVNDEFVVDELQRNNPSLPRFVLELNETDEQSSEPLPKAPDDLAIG